MKKTLNFLMKCVGVEWKKTEQDYIHNLYIYIYVFLTLLSIKSLKDLLMKIQIN